MSDKMTRRRFFTLSAGAGAAALTGALTGQAAPLNLTTQNARHNELFPVYDLDKQAPGINLPGNVLGPALYNRFLKDVVEPGAEPKELMLGTVIWEKVENARREPSPHDATHAITGVSLYLPETEVRPGVWTCGEPKVYCLKVKWLDNKRGQALKHLVGVNPDKFELRLSVAAWANERPDGVWDIHKLEIYGANFWWLPSRPDPDIHRIWWLNRPHPIAWRTLKQQTKDYVMLMLGAPVTGLLITGNQLDQCWDTTISHLDQWSQRQFKRPLMEVCPPPVQLLQEGMLAFAMIIEGRQRVRLIRGSLDAKKQRRRAWEMQQEGQDRLQEFRETLA